MTSEATNGAAPAATNGAETKKEPEKPKEKSIKDDLIVPPPELRSIVEVTVDYVIRNGMSFEGELRKRQQNNRKFDFLIPGNPYYKWYKWKLQCKLDPEAAEQQKQLEEEEKKHQEEILQVDREKKEKDKQAVKVVELSLAQRLEQDIKLFRKCKESLKVQPPEIKCSVPLPPMVTPAEVDIIKLTAQFVARNGRQFLTALTSQHQMDPKFHFLKPIDPRFNYFQKLVTAYNECIVLHSSLIGDLERDLDPDHLFQQALGHSAATMEAEHQRKQNAADEAAVQMAMKLIDWHEFAIVETITFDVDNEYYPAPGKSIEEINDLLDTENRKEISVVLADDVDAEQEVDMDVEDIGMDTSDEEEVVVAAADAQVQQIAPAAAAPAPKPYGADTVVTADVNQEITLETPEDRKLRESLEASLNLEKQMGAYTTCPVTGQQVETSRLSEHIRIALLDPKWKQQKEALLMRMKATSLAQGQDIVSNLSSFNMKHAEQFGVKNPNQPAQPTAMTPVDQARLKAAEEQARLRGLVGGQQHGRPAAEGAPPAKRQRMLADVPESDFLSRFPGTQQITVQVSGQVHQISVSLGKTISELKNLITVQSGVPVTQQTLRNANSGTLIDQDSATLAAYNIGPGVVLAVN